MKSNKILSSSLKDWRLGRYRYPTITIATSICFLFVTAVAAVEITQFYRGRSSRNIKDISISFIVGVLPLICLCVDARVGILACAAASLFLLMWHAGIPSVTFVLFVILFFTTGYLWHLVYSRVIMGITALIFVVRAFNEVHDWTILSILFIIIFSPLMTGGALSLFQKNKLLLQEVISNQDIEEKELIQENNNKIAGQIHEAITTDLSLSLLLIEQMRISNQTNSDLQLIEKCNQQALNKTHQVIRLLQSNRSIHLNHQETLQQFCHEQDQQMKSVRLQGTTKIVSKINGSGELSQLARTILIEVYANIVRHCTPEKDSYSVSIEHDHRGMNIDETNTYQGSELSIPGVQHGEGLALCKKLVMSAGGDFSIKQGKNQWTIHIYIPKGKENR